MTEDYLPLSFDGAPPTAVQGWLRRCPQGVIIAPLPYPTSIPSPEYVLPRKPDTPFRHPHGFEVDEEYYLPDHKAINQAIVELAAMADMPEDDFRQAVDTFVRRYGQIARDARYLETVQNRRLPGEIRSILRDGIMSSRIPLWCYRHEARILSGVLETYRALRDGDVEALQDWKSAWFRVCIDIHSYLYFVGYDTDWQEHATKMRATSPDNLMPYIPKQRMVARNLLGAMYMHLLQVVLEQQLVRSCAGRGCNRLFVPSRSDQIYCTTSCASTERVRRHREKQRTAKD